MRKRQAEVKAQKEPNVINKLIDAPAVEMKVGARDRRLQTKMMSYSLLEMKRTTRMRIKFTSTRGICLNSRASMLFASQNGQTRGIFNVNANANTANALQTLTALIDQV